MNYENMIRDAMKNGTSPEEIAKAFTDAFNKVQKEDSCKQFERDNLIDEMYDIFIDNVDAEDYDVEDIGRLAAIIYANRHPEWSAKDIKEYADQMNQSAAFAAKLVGVDDLDTGLSILEDEIKSQISKALRKPTSEESNIKPSDEDIVKKFLNGLR